MSRTGAPESIRSCGASVKSLHGISYAAAYACFSMLSTTYISSSLNTRVVLHKPQILRTDQLRNCNLSPVAALECRIRSFLCWWMIDEFLQCGLRQRQLALSPWRRRQSPKRFAKRLTMLMVRTHGTAEAERGIARVRVGWRRTAIAAVTVCM